MLSSAGGGEVEEEAVPGRPREERGDEKVKARENILLLEDVDVEVDRRGVGLDVEWSGTSEGGCEAISELTERDAPASRTGGRDHEEIAGGTDLMQSNKRALPKLLLNPSN